MAVRAYRFPVSKTVGLSAVLGEPMRGPRKTFKASDDVLIRQQPVTCMSLKRLATILRTTQAAIRHRARELGVSLVIGVRGGNIDTRTLRHTDKSVDPLLERLKGIREK
jgi:hypothetical protein